MTMGDWLVAILLLYVPPVLWVLGSVYVQDRNAKRHGTRQIIYLEKRVEELKRYEKEHIALIAKQEFEIRKLKMELQNKN